MLEVNEVALQEGEFVTYRYRLVRVLGEGGMGVVWEARDEATGELRALKFLHPSRSDAEAEARFQREARAAIAVSHPNVARVLEVSELPAGSPFLVMERLHGETLRQRLDRRGRLSLDEAPRILSAVVQGVQAIHGAGIVHRDLKPENVFLTEDGGVKVLDFGIAKVLAPGHDARSLTRTGAMIGTLYYMAPEQVFADGDIDGRADVWALGVLLFECLVGQRPTEGQGAGQVLKRITTVPMPRLAQELALCPPELDALCARMLSRARSARPDPAEILRVFEGMRGVALAPTEAGGGANTPLDTLPSVSAPPRPLQPSWTPRALGIGGLLVAAGAVGAIGLSARVADPPLPEKVQIAPDVTSVVAEPALEGGAPEASPALASQPLRAPDRATSAPLPIRPGPRPSGVASSASVAPPASSARALPAPSVRALPTPSAEPVGEPQLTHERH